MRVLLLRLIHVLDGELLLAMLQRTSYSIGQGKRRDKSPSRQRTDYCKDGDLSRLCELGGVIKKPYLNLIVSSPYVFASALTIRVHKNLT
jgi:hypothetical protein